MACRGARPTEADLLRWIVPLLLLAAPLASLASGGHATSAPPVCLVRVWDLCVDLSPVAKISDVGVAASPSAGLAAVTVERGYLRVDAGGTYAEHAIVVPRVNDAPPPAILNATIGSVTTSYHHDQVVARYVAGTTPSIVPVGELWSARLRVFFAGDLVSDDPAVMLR